MSSSPEKERILVVDDSPETLEVLQRNLTAEGYQVFTCTGVVEAIRMLDGGGPGSARSCFAEWS